MVGMVMRIYSLAFHVLLGLIMFAIGLVAWVSDQHTLQIGFLPWKGATLTYCLLGAGAAAIAIALLAFQRIVPVLFVLWSLAVAVMLVKGYFFGTYYFGPSGLWYAVGFVAAALVALVGSAWYLRRGSRRSALA